MCGCSTEVPKDGQCVDSWVTGCSSVCELGPACAKGLKPEVTLALSAEFLFSAKLTPLIMLINGLESMARFVMMFKIDFRTTFRSSSGASYGDPYFITN